MTDSHGQAAGKKSSGSRLVKILLIMLAVAVLAFIPPLFSRGGTGIGSTSSNITPLFIPVWLTLTVGVVVICFYFFKDLVTAERYRDRESPDPSGSSHSH
ncbi:MAG: hypothetical protein JRM86_06090 [Nitrososphaerota archaeon]|nr:hypothetical protein [Nitrososphaerota archaeon]